MFCNVMMLLLLYAHVCVTRTGWKTRPRPKTVILSINKSINQSINQSSLPPLPVAPHKPVSARTAVSYLLQFEDVSDKELLEIFVGKVDAQLLKTVKQNMFFSKRYILAGFQHKRNSQEKVVSMWDKITTVVLGIVQFENP